MRRVRSLSEGLLAPGSLAAAHDALSTQPRSDGEAVVARERDNSHLRKLKSSEVAALLKGNRIHRGRPPAVFEEMFRSDGRYFFYSYGGISPTQLSGTYRVTSDGKVCTFVGERFSDQNRCRYFYKHNSFYFVDTNKPNLVERVTIKLGGK